MLADLVESHHSSLQSSGGFFDFSLQDLLWGGCYMLLICVLGLCSLAFTLVVILKWTHVIPQRVSYRDLLFRAAFLPTTMYILGYSLLALFIVALAFFGPYIDDLM